MDNIILATNILKSWIINFDKEFNEYRDKYPTELHNYIMMINIINDINNYFINILDIIKNKNKLDKYDINHIMICLIQIKDKSYKKYKCCGIPNFIHNLIFFNITPIPNNFIYYIDKTINNISENNKLFDYHITQLEKDINEIDDLLSNVLTIKF